MLIFALYSGLKAGSKGSMLLLYGTLGQLFKLSPKKYQHRYKRLFNRYAMEV